MRNERNWAQYNNCETRKFKKETAADKFNRSFDKFKAKFRNQPETFVDVMTCVAVLAVTMMLYMTLCVEKRQEDHDFV